MPLYDNLPGMELEIKDGNLILPAPPSPTQAVLIIAPTSTTGATGTYADAEYNPVTITGQADFQAKGMGVYDTNNPMARLWKQVYDGGCRDIKVIKLKGVTAVEKYGHLHDIFYVLEENINVDIVLLGGLYSDETVTGDITFGFTREDFAASIAIATAKTTLVEAEAIGTGDALIKEFTLDVKPAIASTLVITNTPAVGEATTVPEADYTFNGNTGVISFTVAPIVGDVLTAEYRHYSYDFAAQLAGFCETVSAKNRQIIGVIALKPPVDVNLSTVKTYIEAQKTQFYSKYLQVIGGATMWFNIGSSIYEDMWHGAYAGLMSILPSYSSPTFKAIPGALFGSYKLSPTQITSLINKHIVCPRERNARIIVAEAITTSSDSSDFVRLTTLKVVNDVISLVREIAEPYIGEPNTVPRRNALDTAIREGLQSMIVRGALNDFRFHITSTVADQIDGTMRIMLDVVPVFETRRILMAVAVKPML